MKTCTKCKTTKPISGFYFKQKSKNQRQPKCKECQVADNYALSVRRKENGVCKDCPSKLNRSNTWYCDDCRRKQTDRNRENRNYRINSGTCVSCRLPVHSVGASVCSSHHVQRIVASSKYSARIKGHQAANPAQVRHLVYGYPRVCRVCGRREPETTLVLDHDHGNHGEVRGWLCHLDNRIEGMIYATNTDPLLWAQRLTEHLINGMRHTTGGDNA